MKTNVTFRFISCILLLIFNLNINAQVNQPILDMKDLARQIHSNTTNVSQPVIAILPKRSSINFTGLTTEKERKLSTFINEQTNLNPAFTTPVLSNSLSKSLLSVDNKRNTLIIEKNLVNRVLIENDIEESQVFLFDHHQLNSFGRMLQANFVAFLTAEFVVSGLEETSVRLRNGRSKQIITHFSITAKYQVELYHVERGVQQSHLSQIIHYNFGPEDCQIYFDVNPNGKYQVTTNSRYSTYPLYSNGIEVSGYWSGNNLAGRMFMLQISVFDSENGNVIRSSSLIPLNNLSMTREILYGAYVTGSQKENFIFYLPLEPFKKVARRKYKKDKKTGQKQSRVQFITEFDFVITLYEIDNCCAGRNKILEKRQTIPTTLLKQLPKFIDR